MSKPLLAVHGDPSFRAAACRSRDVEEDRVPSDVAHRLRLSHGPTFAAQDRREFRLHLHAIRFRRKEDLSAAQQERRRGLQEEHRVIRDRGSHLPRVVGVVPRNTDDLSDEKPSPSEGQGARRAHLWTVGRWVASLNRTTVIATIAKLAAAARTISSAMSPYCWK